MIRLMEFVFSESVVFTMSVVLYIVAVVVILIAFHFFSPEEEASRPTRSSSSPTKELPIQAMVKTLISWRQWPILHTLGLRHPNFLGFRSIEEKYSNVDDLQSAMRRVGLERFQVILGLDFTASNEWQGRRSFGSKSLHHIQPKTQNPYQKAITALGECLRAYMASQQVYALGFGDVKTTDEEVFCVKPDGLPCEDWDDVYQCYTSVARQVTMSGPTSFAPLIERSLQIVEATKCFHLLVILTDGSVAKRQERATANAIIRATDFPLAIVTIGVGDGPWLRLREFDSQLPTRKFDNFHFFEFHPSTTRLKGGAGGASHDEFLLQLLMEVPDQYRFMREHGYC